MGYETFNSNLEYIDLSPAPLNAYPVSMCIWVKEVNDVSFGVVMGIGEDGVGNFVSLQTAGSGPARASQTAYGIDSAAGINSSTWRQMVVVYVDKDNILFRFDGAEVTVSGSGGAVPGDWNILSIGTLDTGFKFAASMIAAEPTVWNIALDSADRILLDTTDPVFVQPGAQVFHATLKLGDTLEDLITSTALTEHGNSGTGELVADHPTFGPPPPVKSLKHVPVVDEDDLVPGAVPTWNGTKWGAAVPDPASDAPAAFHLIEKIDITGPIPSWESSVILRNDRRYKLVIHNLEFDTDTFLQMRVFIGDFVRAGAADYAYSAFYWRPGSDGEQGDNSHSSMRLTRSDTAMEATGTRGFFGTYEFGKSGSNQLWHGIGHSSSWRNDGALLGHVNTFSYRGSFTDVVTGIQLYMGAGFITRLQGALYEMGESVVGSDPGLLLGYDFLIDNTEVSFAGNAPSDDTPPLRTESELYTSKAYANRSATGLVHLSIAVQLGASAGANCFVGLYIDGASEPVAISSNRIAGSGGMHPMVFDYEHTPGDTDQHDYELRFGSFGGSATTFINRPGIGPLYGDTLHSSITIREYDVQGGIVNLSDLGDTDVDSLVPAEGAVLVWNPATQLWEPGSQLTQPAGEVVEPGESINTSFLTTFLDRLPLPAGGFTQYAWDIEHFETPHSLAVLGDTGWIQDANGRGYVHLNFDPNTSSRRFKGLERALDYTGGESFAVCARVSLGASDDNSDIHVGVYTRQTGGSSASQVRTGCSADQAAPRVAQFRFNSTTSFSSTGGSVSNTNYGWVYVALVHQKGVITKSYWSSDGVRWVIMDATNSTHAINAVNAGLLIGTAEDREIAAACDWLAWGVAS